MKKLFLLFFILSQFLFAQNTFEFLKIHSSPRAAALAGAYITNTDDVNNIFYNPAGIALVKDSPISLSFTSYFGDVKLYSVAHSREIENIGRFAGAIKYINYGKFIQADKNGTKLGEFGANEFSLLLGYAKNIYDNFYVGANANFVYSQISEYNSSGIAFDLGGQYLIPSENIVIALSIRNYGTQLSTYSGIKESLPLNVSLGVSKKMQNMPFTFYFMFNKLNNNDDSISDKLKRFSFGGELNLSKAVTIRVGYDAEKRKDLKLGTTTGLVGFNLGVGLNIKDYLIDYSFSSYGEIESVHRFGISTAL